MKANVVFHFFIIALVSAALVIPSDISAKTYQWDDYLTPFRKEIRLGQGSNVIEVNFPDYIIKSYTQIELIVKHSGLEKGVNAQSLSHRLQFSVNERAIVGGYDFIVGNNSSDRQIKIKINTRYLKTGMNRFRFKAQRGYSGKPLTIHELYFYLSDVKTAESLHAYDRSYQPAGKRNFQWDDAKSPFREPITDIKRMQTITVKVFLPEHVKEYDNIPLTIDTVLTHGNIFSAKLYLNTESEWGAYRFKSPSKVGGRVKLMLKAKDLKPGLNVITIKGGPRFDIVGMRLDVPDAPKPKPVIARETVKPKSSKLKKKADPAPAPNLTAPAPKSSQQSNFSASGNAGTGSPELTVDLESDSPAENQKKADHKSARKAQSDTILQPVVTGVRWAVVIGVSNYQDTRIPSLRYASKDAQTFYDWLVSPDGGKYALSRVKLLIDENATENGIRNSLFEWLGQALEEDVVTIFFAGHGSPQSPDKPDNLFLLPYDTQHDSVATTGFPMWDIETALRRFILAKKVVVIADACHAGGVGQAFDVARRASRGINTVSISSNLHNLTKIGDGICIISASDDSQYSQESKKWGGGHGVFTYFLLRGLKGEADYSNDDRVTLGEIVPYLSEQVRRATGNAQSPTVAGRFDPALTIGK